MLRKSWLALYITLLTTIALVFGFLLFGGPTAVTSLVAVLGFLLAIIEFFYLHILSNHQERQLDNRTSHRQVQLRSANTTSSQQPLFRRSRFIQSDDE